LYLCSDTGLMLAMKGIYPHEELTRLPATVELQGVESLKVPGLDAERHLVLLRPTKMVAKG